MTEKETVVEDSDYVELPAAPVSRIFRSTASVKFLRQLSWIAEQQAVNKIGVKMEPSAAVVFLLNSLTGLSLLTMPFGFQQSGVILGSLTVFASMAVSYITATFMLEALTIANALNYEKAEENALENEPERRERLRDERKNIEEKVEKGISDSPPFRKGTLEYFKEEMRKKNACREFKIRERVELGAMGQLVLTSEFSGTAANLIYMVIVSYTYGTASALVVTVATSWGHTMQNIATLCGLELDEMLAYNVSVIISFLITVPLSFADLQKTKKFTFVIMVCRFAAILILLLVASWQSYRRVQEEGWTTVMKGVPLWQPSGFVAVFGNSVFLFGLHHYLPSMMSPLEPQSQAPGVIRCGFGICYFLLVAVCFTALTAWGGETHAKCASHPGGHFCSIQPLYNLNFSPLSLGGGSVALFLLAYPAMAIASIPVAVITTRNTIGQWLGGWLEKRGVPLARLQESYTRPNIILTLFVVTPPFVVALITQNVQAVIQYVGGYAGLTVAFFCPTILLYKCRQALKLDDMDAPADRPLKSSFANRFGYTLVYCSYAIALYMVTLKLFFT
ncbi:unnamed protein product [Effrenium voratum]|uniref:Amino acid transporter transmembrane domain-containing protein n=1 Tax=Effrenium voratum TaxID=2562239 RepID=A0AA36JFJ5_9DINO|nr:unnamed protein product [Effrenium voratum]